MQIQSKGQIIIGDDIRSEWASNFGVDADCEEMKSLIADVEDLCFHHYKEGYNERDHEEVSL